MAEEQQREQGLLFPTPYLVGRVLGTLPTPCFSLGEGGWSFIYQDGVSRPGVEMNILMKPLSGGSIRIKVAFWGNGSPRKAIYTNFTSTTEVKLVYLGDDPWEFIRILREGASALRR